MEPEISRDGIFYLAIGQRWGDAGFRDLAILYHSSANCPLLLWIIYAGEKTGLDPEIASWIFNISLGCGLIFLMYLAGVECTGSKGMGLLIAWLTAIHPSLVKWSYQVQREIPYLFFIVLAGVLFFQALNRNSRWRWVVSGFCIVIGMSARVEALEWIIVVPLLLGWHEFTHEKKYIDLYKKGGLWGGGFLAGCLVLSLLPGVSGMFPLHTEHSYFQHLLQLLSKLSGGAGPQ